MNWDFQYRNTQTNNKQWNDYYKQMTSGECDSQIWISKVHNVYGWKDDQLL